MKNDYSKKGLVDLLNSEEHCLAVPLLPVKTDFLLSFFFMPLTDLSSFLFISLLKRRLEQWNKIKTD